MLNPLDLQDPETLLLKIGKYLARNSRGFFVTALSEFFALIYHICFLIFFYTHRIPQMFYFNIFSVAIFAICIFILFRFKKVAPIFFITIVEVIAHQICAEYFCGAQSGFHFLIMILVVYPFLIEKKNFMVGFPLAFLCLAIFFGCEIFMPMFKPIYNLSVPDIKLLKNINVISSMTVILTMIVIFKLIINYIEKNMEILNQKNEALLENILPKKVIQKLREEGHADPERFDNVSILFTDIVNFTNLSKSMPPEELISELNTIFTVFDAIMEKHSCERIKTIGDAYMAVCGLPEKNPDHAKNLVAAALECRDYLKERNASAKHKWTIRLGINTGSVVAGIVGTTKYIYDVFGDSVNVSSRMESNSVEMRLLVSKDLAKLVYKDFAVYKAGTKEIKGKGPMEVFFVENKK